MLVLGSKAGEQFSGGTKSLTNWPGNDPCLGGLKIPVTWTKDIRLT